MNIKRLAIDTITSIIIWLIFYFFLFADREYRLADSFFVTGAFTLTFAVIRVIQYEGLFDSISYSFVKLRYNYKKKSTLRSEDEKKKNEQLINLGSPSSSFYDYREEKKKARKAPNALYGTLLGMLYIFISFIIT